MKVADYNEFVERTDQYQHKPLSERRAIAIYGLVGEVGSLTSAIKKKLLTEGGQQEWNQPNDEVNEELGDVIWYCFSLAQIENPSGKVNILTHDIALLKREISGQNARARKIHAALDSTDPKKRERFLALAGSFPSTRDMDFDHYQQLAFLTARTEGRDLFEVCIAVLWQLGAELLRKTLPDIELTVNKNLADRPVNVILGEIAWHLSAVASLLQLSMNSVVHKNVQKVTFRANRDRPTPLHDADREAFEQLPRRFAVTFVTVGRGVSRMYLQGKQLGDDLNDNSYEDDGYRFHDVLHLASVAHLGWSPVIRKLMGKKRKSRNDQVDEVEDGARAQIVEELVQKAIHAEGRRLASESGRCEASGPTRAFPSRSLITFRFLKSLRGFVEGLEVWENQYWEWENAIFDGAALYYSLQLEQQGTVTVDMERRSISYDPDVSLDLSGGSVGLGVGKAFRKDTERDRVTILTQQERLGVESKGDIARLVSIKRSIIDALRITDPHWDELEVKLVNERCPSVRAKGRIRQRMWDAKAVSFQLALSESDSRVECTAIAIADIKDLAS